jgi:UDP-N-acetylmuramoyl-L-alanyl-D-glutamate--2,6-diaminopimelate ligase
MPVLKDILKGVGHKPLGEASSFAVGGIADDSRAVKKNDLFIAVRGHDTDGQRFIKDAIGRGASAVVSDRDFSSDGRIKKIIVNNARRALPLIADNFYGHPSSRLKMIGVTGTNGKTTITYILESIISAAGKSSGVIGTINYRICAKSLPSTNTTPGPVRLQSLLSDMLKCGADYGIMEVSSHSLDQDRCACVSFDAAIFTNITKEHLDYHKTMDRYLAAKARLFAKLKPAGFAVINNDDDASSRLKSAVKKGRVVTYGIDKRSDVTARDIKISIGHSEFTVVHGGGSFRIKTALIGRHNVYNILASVAASMALGIRPSVVKRGVESFRSVPGRLELVRTRKRLRVFVDYAHTEDALYNVLSLLKGVVSNGRIITVFGCGGDRDRSKRPLMGKVACKLSDNVVITSDNPRSEDPKDIISQIESGIKGLFDNYCMLPDRRQAIRKAIGMASEKDIVLIAGKGHETYQIIGNRILPFDDRKVAKEALA